MNIKLFFIFLFSSLCIFLAPIANATVIVDSRGGQNLNVASRVITLNWGATEALISLGVAPVGMADNDGYRDWVQWPTLPDGIHNVGTRSEPNIEVIQSLKPDLIILSAAQQEIAAKLKPIAPILVFDTFRADHNNGEVIDNEYLEIAKAVGKREVAEQRLQAREDKIKAWKAQLTDKFAGNIPNVSLVHFRDTSHVALYGANSTVEYALNKLGISLALPTPTTAWGQVDKPVSELAKIGSGVLIYIKPFNDEKALFSSQLWRHMPFVRQHRFTAIEPCWTFGSALSIEHIAQATTNALLALEN